MEPRLFIADIAELLNITHPAVHNKIKNLNINPKKAGNRFYIENNDAKKIFKISIQNRIISIQIVKGGTGKTSIANALAMRSCLLGANILCIDLDQQANLTSSFGVEKNPKKVFFDVVSSEIPIEASIITIMPGLDLIPSGLKTVLLDRYIMTHAKNLDSLYRKILSPLKKYDLIFFDCPPAIGHSVSSATLASDLVICPVYPDQFCLDGLDLTWHEIQALNKDYNKNISVKILLNRIDERTVLSNKLSAQLINNETYSKHIFSCFIKSSQEFAKAIEQGSSIFDNSRQTSVKRDVDNIVKILLGL